MTDIKDTFGDRIKQLRKYHNMTQQVFAQKIGVTKQTVCEYEKNKSSLSENTLFRLCQYFGVTKEWLIEGIGEMYPVSTAEERNNLPMPDTEIMENKISEGEKRLIEAARRMGVSMPVLNDLMDLVVKDNSTAELFVKCMQGDETAKKDLMIKLLQK